MKSVIMIFMVVFVLQVFVGLAAGVEVQGDHGLENMTVSDKGVEISEDVCVVENQAMVFSKIGFMNHGARVESVFEDYTLQTGHGKVLHLSGKQANRGDELHVSVKFWVEGDESKPIEQPTMEYSGLFDDRIPIPNNALRIGLEFQCKGHRYEYCAAHFIWCWDWGTTHANCNHLEFLAAIECPVNDTDAFTDGPSTTISYEQHNRSCKAQRKDKINVFKRQTLESCKDLCTKRSAGATINGLPIDLTNECSFLVFKPSKKRCTLLKKCRNMPAKRSETILAKFRPPASP